MSIRLLLLADTHLGLDLPRRPRVEKPRRGQDFFSNTRRALEPARRREVDLVVHGGDLLYRSKVSRELVSQALETLLEVADLGVPVILVPGNHERSSLPYPLLGAHSHLHIIDQPRVVELELKGIPVAVGGFPCVRNGVRDHFQALVHRTGLLSSPARIRLLCLHQTVEGSKVGPSDFTFRSGADVIPGRLIPEGLAAVLAGHIHRAQMLRHDLSGRPLAAPVLYPGSIERTSRAERYERKGFVIAEIRPGGSAGGMLVNARLEPLPTREMIDLEIDPSGRDIVAISEAIAAALRRVPPTAIVRVRLRQSPGPEISGQLSASMLRSLAPEDMIVDWDRRGSTERRRTVGDGEA